MPGREPRFLDSTYEAPAAVAAAEPPPPPVAPPPPSSAPVPPPESIAEQQMAEAAVPEPVAAPEPIPVPKPEEESPGFFGRLFGSSPPKASSAEGVVGSVDVAEAVRVPLSNEGERAPRARAVPVIAQVHPIAGSPGASTARTFWAQISYFRDEAQAMSFYRQFSDTYPQFTEGVRVRVTKPFSSHSGGKVSLRVGPFAGTDDVHAICGAASRWSARCTVVRDLGSSTAAGKGSVPRGIRAEAPAGETYWVQLGTYDTEEEANEIWDDIKGRHRKLVKNVRSTVTTPPSSSAARQLYRLRAGSFRSADKANGFCRRLQDVGVDCLVVNDR